MPRHMPLQLQIYILKKNLLRYNPDIIDDPYLIPNPSMHRDEEWTEHLDEMSLPENIGALEQIFPNVQWRKPYEEKYPQRERRYINWKVTSSREDPFTTYTTEVTIKPQEFKAKGKTYLHGRIQLIVDQKWIDRKAKISINIPKPHWGKKRSWRRKKQE